LARRPHRAQNQPSIPSRIGQPLARGKALPVFCVRVAFFCELCGHRATGPGKCPQDGRVLHKPVHGTLLGEKLGNYVVIGELGTGGMGDVYRAINPLITTQVAIKVLNASCANDASARQRLLREAQTVNRIDSTGVVKVNDAGVLLDGRPYIVMELLDGKSLSEHLREGRPPLAETYRVMLDVLAIIDAAHRASIIHRDLKPPNVFLALNGTHILDFGIAKLLDPGGDAGLTSTGAVIGTPHYMAPEQIQAKPVDARTDVYAAAVVMYEMLVGRRPFEGNSDFEVLSGHVERRPPPPRALNPEISPDLQSIVLAALAKDPAHRFQTAAAMRTALLHVVRASSAPG
jgi:serine/threonine protein kinase